MEERASIKGEFQHPPRELFSDEMYSLNCTQDVW